jgi:OMF family outer membrane factor
LLFSSRLSLAFGFTNDYPLNIKFMIKPMLIFRHLLTASIAGSASLIWGMSATAQINPDPAAPASETLPQERQTQPSTEGRSDDRAPENLNPSGNPLQFPTKPEEVEVGDPEAITLNQAIELAIKNNRQLQSARQTLERTQAELDEAQSAWLPTLETQLELDRTTQAQPQFNFGGLSQGELQDIDSTNLTGTLDLNYGIYTGGRRGATIARAERSLQQQKLEVERIAEEVRFNATDLYYQLQNADAQVSISQAAVDDASQSLRDAQLLEKAGLGTRFDTLRSEVDLARAEQELTSNISAQRVARRRLIEILSVGQQVELVAADEIQPAGNWELTLEESIVQAFKNRAELEQQLLAREIANDDRQIALADIRPQVSFFAQYNVDNNFDDSTDFADGYAVGARMNWTLFDGGNANSRARQAESNRDIAETEFARQRNEIRREVEEAYFQLDSNQDNINTTQLNVERATESLRLARLRFQAGVGTQTEVIDSQRDLTDARSQYLQAVIGYNQSLNNLQRAVSNQPDNRLFELR